MTGHRSRMSGFTLVELMIVVIVIAILAAVAIPNFKSTIATNRIKEGANSLASDLAAARAEAIKRGTPVSVCASTDGATCSGSASDWDQGWILFIDQDAAGSVDGDDIILKAHDALPDSVTVDTITVDFIRMWPTGERG